MRPCLCVLCAPDLLLALQIDSSIDLFPITLLPMSYLTLAVFSALLPHLVLTLRCTLNPGILLFPCTVYNLQS